MVRVQRVEMAHLPASGLCHGREHLVSRELCSRCGGVVSTTADPNDKEGFFVTLEDCEKLDAEIGENTITFYGRGWLNDNCLRLVLCESCQYEIKTGTTGTQKETQ